MSFIQPPIGFYRPTFFQNLILGATRRLPAGWLPQRVGHALRKLGLASLKRTPIDVPVYRGRMRLYPHDNLCEKRVLFMPQLYDRAERRVLLERMHDNYVFIDVGANVGIYSLFVAGEAGPSAKVLAVEADPEMQERLNFNLQSSRFKNVTVVPKAVGSECGEVSFYVERANRGESSLLEKEGAERLTVESVTLLKLLDEHQIDVPDAVKIDVEGAEMSVLKAFFDEAPPIRHPRLLILECFAKDDLSEAAKLAMSRRYHVKERAKMNVILEKAA